MPAAMKRLYGKASRCRIQTSTKLIQLSEFKSLQLPVIGGKECHGVTRTPQHEETFKVGQKISVKALHTPCHTKDSICWLMEDGDQRVVFTGDTLFIGGSAADMHAALNTTLAALPDDTKVYPGHEYTKQNVRFLTTVLDTEPVQALQAFADNNRQTQGKFTIGDEKASVPPPPLSPPDSARGMILTAITMNSAEQETNGAAGAPLSTKSKVLENSAAMAQVNVRQCLIYDTPEPNAKLIGVEYMISGKLFKTLDAAERKLWHSHVFEVKSGMLFMPGPEGMPTSIWEEAEIKEMEEIVGLYGKTYHFWQVDRGDKLPLGEPQLMGSLTHEDQGGEALKAMWKARDEKFRISTEQKKAKRQYIEEPEVHDDADQTWKK
ncbi:MAG: hypothetical protein Q9211_003591 [Gyalolechia sp. 1 TL-2023]